MEKERRVCYEKAVEDAGRVLSHLRKITNGRSSSLRDPSITEERARPAETLAGPHLFVVKPANIRREGLWQVRPHPPKLTAPPPIAGKAGRGYGGHDPLRSRYRQPYPGYPPDTGQQQDSPGQQDKGPQEGKRRGDSPV